MRPSASQAMKPVLLLLAVVEKEAVMLRVDILSDAADSARLPRCTHMAPTKAADGNFIFLRKSQKAASELGVTGDA